MKDEALKLALEALENVAVTGPDADGLVWINLPGNGTTGKAILRVGKAGLIAAQCAQLYEEQRTKAITAIKQALAAPTVQEPLRGWWAHTNPETGLVDVVNYQLTQADKAHGWLEQEIYTTPPAAQPAPVQEPVATLFGSLPVYDTPPAAQRPWVGLTAEERAEIVGFAAIFDWHDFEVIGAVEAKLKEKNT